MRLMSDLITSRRAVWAILRLARVASGKRLSVNHVYEPEPRFTSAG